MCYNKQFNDQTEEFEDYISVQASKADELTEIKDLEEDELSKLNRNIEQNLII